MTKAKAKQELYNLFIRNGCIRLPSKKRKKEGESYKKGYEIRWTAFSKKEAYQIIKMLKSLEIKPGKSYEKNNRVVIPVYNKEVVTGFLGLEGESTTGKKIVKKKLKPAAKRKTSKKKPTAQRKKTKRK